MHILDRIVQHKKQEIISWKEAISESSLKTSKYYERPTISLASSLRNGSGIIAEFKRKSPSKSNINTDANPVQIAAAYSDGGVSGISVLADELFFGAQQEDILQVRSAVNIPLLRKEFIIDVYQIYQAKAYGADAILLIAAILDTNALNEFTETARSIGLEVLTEIHDFSEFEKIDILPDMLGINNRNLKTFETDPYYCIKLKEQINLEICWVAESGISDPNIIKELRNEGFNGFLIGEYLMKSEHPTTLLHQINSVIGYEN